MYFCTQALYGCVYGLGWPLAISWRLGFSGKGFHILNIVELQADRGCTAGAIFWGAGGVGVLVHKKGVTLRGLRISQKKEILRKLILL